MKQEGVLLSTDGPLHNVIKIKPPLVFSAANADFFLTRLERVLQEDRFQI
jgi:4-aminobutyrate aminotransferase-like enzyme